MSSVGWVEVKDGDVYEGKSKLERVGPGWIYQDVIIPSTAFRSSFSCWEKTPSPDPSQTRLVITIRNTSNAVLGTLYDGPMNNSWTVHTADLIGHTGQQRRIYIETGDASG